MQSEDLISVIFPDQLACLENVVGEREIPDHPLVNQTIHDCLYEAIDIEELEALLTRIKNGEVQTIAVDLREPSPMSEEILNARPFAFLDDAPLEERRVNAVANRRWLDQAAIDSVRSEAWPQVRSASFFDEIVSQTGLLRTKTEEALAELVAAGYITADSFTGLRAFLVDSKYRTRGRRRRHLSFKLEQAGRWSLLNAANTECEPTLDTDAIEKIAWVLLRRYGVVFRKLADRENFAPAWRDLVRVYRTLEARGEVCGGRFVDGVWGEQYALPEAVTKLRAVRKEANTGTRISISGADPLNLTGVITPGKRVAGIFGNRILYEDGVPVAVKEGKEVAYLNHPEDTKAEWAMREALIRREISPRLRAYLGKGIS